MRGSTRQEHWLDAIHRFRMGRHHLLGEPPVPPVTLCRDICGAQAQLTTAAQLQLWTRNHSISRKQIAADLWRRRALVKTWLMRQTLHWIPSNEFAIYIAAFGRCRREMAL